MEPTANEIAGLVDLFGALTRGEVGNALAELAFKRGAEYDPGEFDAEIESALESYHLVSVPAAEHDVDVDRPLVLVGPVAFPELPEGATDLPHILDVDERQVDSETAVRAAQERFRSDAAAAVNLGDIERMADLLDASYELEAWGDVDLSDARARLADARENAGQ